MGKLLVFARENRSQPGRTAPNEEANVVLFTGIRYERHQRPEKPKPNTGPKTKKSG